MAKIDDNAAAFEALQAKQNGVADGDDDVVVADPPDTKDDKAEKGEKSVGFLSYEEYIEKGGDPKKYKGEDAYNDYYKLLAELKDTKKEVKTFTQQLLAASEATLAKERAAMKASLESELKRQKDEGDVDGALETKEKLTELKQEIKKGPVPVNPVIAEFIEENPLIDKDSDDFNQDFYDDMVRLQAKEINALSDQGGIDLTDKQVLKCTRLAFEKAKALNADLFKPEVSERNNRQGLGRNGGKGGDGGKGQSFEVRLKNLKMDNNRSPDLNPNPAYDMYKHIKEKYGDKAADKFARSALSEE